MKRTVIIVLFSIIVLFVFSCCAVSDSDDNLLPSWLMEKSWKGKLENSLNENPADLSEAVAEAFEIKASANDIYIPSIYGESVSGEIAISVVYGAD